MKRFILFLILVVILYAAKPLWEESVSQHVDLSFLEPVDEKVDDFLLSEPVATILRYVGEVTEKASSLLKQEITVRHTPPAEVEKPILTKPKESQISIHNIEIGSTEEAVNAALGEPKSQSMNEYGTEWVTYHEDYQNFVMVSFDDRRTVNAIYTNDDLISSETGIQYGTEQSVVRSEYGEPLTEIRKGLNIFLLQNTDEFDLFQVDNMYLYIFYDLHQNNTVTAVQLVEKSLEQKKNTLYTNGNDQLRAGFEMQLFDLTNAARVRHGLSYLEWDDPSSSTARDHSLDMATQNYFSHDNLQGQSPFDRLEADQISFRAAGENLAYGQVSSIFAHEGLMNSKGHRDNILLSTYNRLGIGVAFSKENQPYFTENFLLK